MVLFSSMCTCEVQVALLPVADAWVRVAVSQVPIVANTDRWNACLSLFIPRDQRSRRKEGEKWCRGLLLLGWVRWPACAQDWDADARAFSFPIRSFLVNSRGSGSRRVGGSSGASGAEGDALATVLRCRRAFVVKGRSGAARVWRIGVRQGGSTARGGRFSAVVLVDLPLSPPSPSPALPPPPPSPPLPRRRALREGQRRRRACALELERSGRSAAPGTPPSLAPSSSALPWRRRWRTPAWRGDGGTGQIRRPRARPVAAASGSGGLDVWLGRWRRPPRAPSRPNLARPPPPSFLAGGRGGFPHGAMAGSRSPASGAVERRQQLLQARRRGPKTMATRRRMRGRRGRDCGLIFH